MSQEEREIQEFDRGEETAAQDREHRTEISIQSRRSPSGKDSQKPTIERGSEERK
ncbi:MAG: hypothetical protein HRF40_13650 [Nitrososphaera sp.]